MADLLDKLIGDESPGRPGLPFTSVVERILQKVIFSEEIILPGRGPCWLWQGRLNKNGYGRSYYVPEKKEVVCHRIMWCEMIGAIPPGKILDHLCKVRRCCSTWHMEPVTHRENTLRGDAILYKKREDYQLSLLLQEPDK